MKNKISHTIKFIFFIEGVSFSVNCGRIEIDESLNLLLFFTRLFVRETIADMSSSDTKRAVDLFNLATTKTIQKERRQCFNKTIDILTNTNNNIDPGLCITSINIFEEFSNLYFAPGPKNSVTPWKHQARLLTRHSLLSDQHRVRIRNELLEFWKHYSSHHVIFRSALSTVSIVPTQPLPSSQLDGVNDFILNNEPDTIGGFKIVFRYQQNGKDHAIKLMRISDKLRFERYSSSIFEESFESGLTETWTLIPEIALLSRDEDALKKRFPSPAAICCKKS